MKLCQIVGARPQFIKYYPVSAAIEKVNREAPGAIHDVLIHTGQHYDYDMSKVFFDELGIREPDHHLEAGSGLHGQQTADILIKTEAVLKEEKPDIVIVYGDTNSTLGGALAAAKLNIPVAHVEAGLRSFNRSMPEEINRILTDRISHRLFCPSMTAMGHLEREGFQICDNGRPERTEEPCALFTGDVMADVFIHAGQIAASRPSVLESLDAEPGRFALLTLHRAENTDDPGRFSKIQEFINQMAEDIPVVFPVHPRVQNRLKEQLGGFHNNVRTIQPAGYFSLLQLLGACAFVLTDSGGLQKEAFWARKPCITLRDETEWVETVDAGWNVLWTHFTTLDALPKKQAAPYGDGHAAEKIVRYLLS
ncbi:UDP-N-acetylglucosamine 2-epimerase (non-hydrolyzing) [bacterium]|nr:UDP-N-acetylglucosamine 2-epimerase (non-hydrolyzing) [bacterium]